MNTKICKNENPELGWARPDGAIRHAPISRTTFYDLIRRGVVESHRIGKSATGRGIRLISLRSLDDYIRDPQAAELRAAGEKQHGEIAANGAKQPAAAGKSGNSLGTL